MHIHFISLQLSRVKLGKSEILNWLGMKLIVQVVDRELPTPLMMDQRRPLKSSQSLLRPIN